MKAQPFDFTGMGIALVTPFNNDGSVDTVALADLVNRQIDRGADYIVVLGTTSESPTLSAEERLEVMQLVKDVAADRVPLVLGCGGNNTAALVAQLQSGITDGFDAILSVVPYYNKPTQEGMYRHYMALADASPVPVILYNVPGRTGVNMEAETTLRLARDHRNIVAIKEASGRLEQVKDIIDGKPEGFKVVSGDDALTLQLMQMGACGVISVIGNAFTREFNSMVHSMLDGDEAAAQVVNNRLEAMYGLMTVNGNPAGVKGLLSEMGLCANVLRLPLVPATADTMQKISAALCEVRQN